MMTGIPLLSFDSSYLKKEVLEAIEYISEQLFEKYSGLDFTIVRKTEGGNAIWFVIHDRNIFQTNEFQEFFIFDILRDYLWPKKIYNIVFIFDEKK